ncbi:MAG: hypothetical protein OXB88_03805, partial [Bacteriovoracales bacterium]|nr:hypothetical protein [Bacteriovoracales bacterium]
MNPPELQEKILLVNFPKETGQSFLKKLQKIFFPTPIDFDLLCEDEELSDENLGVDYSFIFIYDGIGISRSKDSSPFLKVRRAFPFSELFVVTHRK